MGASRDYSGAGDSQIDYGDTTILDSATAMTACCWINPDNLTTPGGATLTKGSFTGGAYYSYFDTDGGDYHFFYVRSDADVNSIYRSSGELSTLFTAGTWAFMAYTWTTPKTWTYYINGVSKALTEYTAGEPASIANNAIPIQTGGFQPSAIGYDGKMAFNMLYAAALSAAQVLELMYNPLCIFGSAKFIAPGWEATATNEKDLVSNLAGTPSNATSIADGPPVFVLGGQ